MGWHPERGLIERNWDGYNEGMFVYILALGAPVHAVPPNSWEQWTAPYPELLARRRADAPPRLRAAVRTPVQPHLHRLPRHFRRADAGSGLRLFREQPPRDLCQPRLLHRQPDALGRLFEPHLGPDRLRRAGQLRAAVQGRAANLLRLCRARTAGRAGRARRRHDRADRRARLAAVRARDRDPCRRGSARRPRHAASSTSTASRTASTRASPTRTRSSRPARSIRSTAGSPTDYLGIDQGPILLQAANYRDDFVWKFTRQVPAIRLGLKRAGFTGGWLG